MILLQICCDSQQATCRKSNQIVSFNKFIKQIIWNEYTDWYIFVEQFYQMGKSEQTKAFIIEKTAPLFNSKGYAGTSLSDITDATKLTKGSVYGNFANKDEVALAVFDYNLNKVTSIFAEEMARRSSAREKLLVFGEVYYNYDKYSFPTGGCPILNTAIESDDTHPELKKKVAVAINNWKKNIISIIEKGMEAKEFAKETDAEQAAITIIALLEGGIMISRVTGKPAYRAMIMQSLQNYIDQMK
jgi:TetR/AcrR family transcriptional repressor of nem operon